jgi:putative acetyltransferase
MVIVKHEESKDIVAVRRVNEKAFGQKAEADLVDKLRQLKDITIVSLVATTGEDVAGHILFSPVKVTNTEGEWEAMGLGPVSVLPEFQGRGIGTRLVETGLDECRKLGFEVVFVLGHPDFYPRFGFSPSKPQGIEWEGSAPEEAFMIVELCEGALENRKGIVKYLPEFDAV